MIIPMLRPNNARIGTIKTIKNKLAFTLMSVPEILNIKITISNKEN
jgi:hypothetical protein